MLSGGVKGGKMWKKVFQRLADKGNAELRVGIVKTATTVDGDNIAQYAYYNEYGTKRGIPARPFMRQTFDAHKDEWSSQIKGMVKANPESVRGAFEAVGVLAVAQMNETIEKSGSFAPNAPSTIKRKENRDASGTPTREAPPPLVDTGQMEEAISYEVVP